MPSTTRTGGMKEIGYAEPSYDPEFDSRIDEAYERAKKRKRRNSVIIAVVLIIMLMVYFFYRF